MKVQSMKCPCCGALLDYENGDKTVTCEFCGTKSVVNELVHDRMHSNTEAEKLINSGNGMLEIQEYDEAKAFFDKAREIDPTDYRVYTGLINCATKGFSLVYVPEMTEWEQKELRDAFWSIDDYTTKIRGIGAVEKCKDTLKQLEEWIKKNKEVLEQRINWINSENKERETQRNAHFQIVSEKRKTAKIVLSVFGVVSLILLVITGISFLKRCGEGRPWVGMLVLSFLIFFAGVFCLGGASTADEWNFSKGSEDIKASIPFHGEDEMLTTLRSIRTR